jgi:FkbM family methyltransferase
MISYAANAEDVLLRRALGDAPGGFYIDVGANDPVTDNVTKHFSLRGWTGINIDPVTSCAERLRADRPRDVNLQMGLSDREGTLTLYDNLTETQLSTFLPEIAEHYTKLGHRYVEKRVRVTTLAAICDEHARGRTIDFLKIDVEWHEREVIAGGDWVRHRPRVVLAENNAADAWEPLLLGVGYLYAACDAINRYYVREEEPALLEPFRLPVSQLDEYIPYRYHRAIEEANRRAEAIAGGLPGPAALRVATYLSETARRHPRMASLARKFLKAG